MSLDWLNYILTALGIALTLSGLVLAIYGWYNLHRADRLVEEKVKTYLAEIEERLYRRLSTTEEALQKISSAYAVSAMGDHERAIALLEAALAINPRAFNGFTALGYEFLAIGKIEEAIESFFKAKSLFPDRFEPYLDLARVYAQIDKTELALKYLREGLERNPVAVSDIEQDPVFDSLREKDPEQYKTLITRFEG